MREDLFTQVCHLVAYDYCMNKYWRESSKQKLTSINDLVHQLLRPQTVIQASKQTEDEAVITHVSFTHAVQQCWLS